MLRRSMALQAARFEEGSDLPFVIDGRDERGEIGASNGETGSEKRAVALGQGSGSCFHDAIRLEGRPGAAGLLLLRSSNVKDVRAPRLVIVPASAISHSMSTSIPETALLWDWVMFIYSAALRRGINWMAFSGFADCKMQRPVGRRRLSQQAALHLCRRSRPAPSARLA